MQPCQTHWDALRKAIDDRNLSHLVAQGGEKAVRKIALELQQREVTKESFDPLLLAFFAISGNVMDTLGKAGMNPLYLLSNAPEDPVTGWPGYEGRTWPRCPLCYINLAHEVSCRDARCTLDRVHGYDWMIDRAADEAVERARALGLIPPPS